jgi:hypothetical protein
MLKNLNPNAECFQGKNFPCPICGLALAIRISSRQKPYCVCNVCGIQLFFRGKAGIERLSKTLESAPLVVSGESRADLAMLLLGRLQALKNQRDALKEKQGFFFQDPDLQNAISVIEVELQQIQEELKKLLSKTRPEKKK